MATLPEPPTSSELIHRLQQQPGRDEAAWRDFFERYGGCVRGWCRKYRFQDADVENATQEVMIKLHKGIQSYRRAKGRFRPWFGQVVHNTLDRFARQARAGAIVLTPEAQKVIDNVAAREDLAASFERRCDEELFEKASANVRRDIGEKIWEYFQLVRLDGVAACDVAERLGVTPSAVSKNVKRVMARLAAEVKELDGDNESP